VTVEDALEELAALAEPGRGRKMEAYHKIARPYLGVPLPAINRATAGWRQALAPVERVALAQGLWATNVFEARVAAGKVLTAAKIRPEDISTWRCIANFVPDFDSWAIADHASKAGGLRLEADPRRLDEVEGWIASPHLWTRRAALVMTLGWTRISRRPTPEDEAVRERVLGWAAAMADQREWFIQKAIGWWLRELSKAAPERARAFLDRNGARLKPFARKEAATYLR
jgi:3-methyladenine DNA glycosylase AlkD